MLLESFLSRDIMQVIKNRKNLYDLGKIEQFSQDIC